MYLQTPKKSLLKSQFDKINRIRITEILEVKTENCDVKTLTFNDKLCGKANPGQFVMVWIPGVDEIPISLSGINAK